MPSTETFIDLRHRIRNAAQPGQFNSARQSDHFSAATTKETTAMKTQRFNASHYTSQGTVLCNDCNGKTMTNMNVMANTASVGDDAPKYAHVALMEGDEPIAFFTPENARELARALNSAASVSGYDRADC